MSWDKGPHTDHRAHTANSKEKQAVRTVVLWIVKCFGCRCSESCHFLQFNINNTWPSPLTFFFFYSKSGLLSHHRKPQCYHCSHNSILFQFNCICIEPNHNIHYLKALITQWGLWSFPQKSFEPGCRVQSVGYQVWRSGRTTLPRKNNHGGISSVSRVFHLSARFIRLTLSYGTQLH